MIHNAQIKSTQLGVEGHGIFTFLLELKYNGSSHQGFGCWPLKNPGGGALLARILEVVGVDEWSKLQGEYVRIERTNERITAIGHIIKDRWLTAEAIPELLENGKAA